MPDAAGRRRWWSFADPVGAVVATDLDEVEPAIRAAQEATASGRWAVGFVAYDAAPAFDPALAAHRDPTVPLTGFGLFERRTEIDLSALDREPFRCGPWRPRTGPEEHRRSMATIHDHIAAGDTYQVNLTLRADAPFDGDPLGLFVAMARAQGGDHGVYLELGDHVVCSASPELFLERRGRAVRSRPMKGTRPRGGSGAEDRAIAAELAACEKDRAENTMIVDMVRNDLGRVADVGTLTVTDLHRIEHYPTVHQMVSTVEASTDADLFQLLCATFPPASITGAPKVSTSRIISAVEPDGRGVYTGAVGVAGPGGDLALDVAIRTVWIDRRAGRATYGTGGGIVWDSDPDQEWAEARTKMRVVESAPAPFRLLETMVTTPGGGVHRLDRHLGRLDRSAHRFGFAVDIDRVAAQVQAAVQAPGPIERPTRIRLLVDADGAIEIETSPAPPCEAEPWLVPIDETGDGTPPVRADDLFLRHKTTHRPAYEAARARWPGAPDVILWNERGEVTETTIGNLVVVVDGAAVTPPVASGLLPGTMRAELLARGELVERVVTLDDLRRADRVEMINSVRGRQLIVPLFPSP